MLNHEENTSMFKVYHARNRHWLFGETPESQGLSMNERSSVCQAR